AFEFNVNGAFIGALEPLDRLPDGRSADVLSHTHFLATPFLPCGKAHAPVKKFTGNADCGGPPEDLLTAAIHAFSHYVSIYSGNNLVLCDLQGIISLPLIVILSLTSFPAGMCNRRNIMMLIDPQSHS
ncbi:hypothetical protein B0H15DRAFT_793713, partial [Mycena belliarum]